MSTAVNGSTEPEYIRTFVAIDTNDEIKHKLGRVQEELRRLDNGVRWTAPDIMHFTLVFLGDIRLDAADSVAAIMDTVALATPAFRYSVTGLGFFGSRRRPLVVWAGIAADEPLFAMQRALCDEFRKLGIAIEDRPFTPHLTIGRIRTLRNSGEFMDKIQSSADRPLGTAIADSILLVRSILRPTGPEYKTLHRSPLGHAAGSRA